MAALPPHNLPAVSVTARRRAQASSARQHVTSLAPFTDRHLGRPWKKLEKRRAKEAKEGAPLASSRHERGSTVKVLLLAAPQLGSCAFSGRAWWL